jgi:hypothetical protein
MATKAIEQRVQKMRALRAQATNEGWSNEELDEALAKLYRGSRAPKAKG